MEENSNRGQNRIGIIISVVAVIACLYHLVTVAWLVLPLEQHKIVHIAMAITLVYLLTLEKLKGFKIGVVSLFALLGIVSSLYFFINFDYLVQKIGTPTNTETIIAMVLLVLVLDATRRAWGWIIPLLIVLALLYGYFGPYLPGILNHGGMSIQRLMGYSVINFQGILGPLTSLGVREVFMFVVLGTTLQASGATNFFMKIAKGVGKNFRSGPAQAAVISSSLMGSVSGNITTNVATTGPITIPLMNKSGYSKEYAGGIEAAASTGGQIMPPVMGVSAFIIVNNTGVPYAQLILIALFPALIYYFYLAYSAQLRAIKLNIAINKNENHYILKAIKEDGYLMFAFVVLLAALYTGAAVAMAALYTIVSIVVLVALKKLITLRSNYKQFIKEMGLFLFDALKSGAINGLKLGLIMAALGVMVEMLVVTGFAQRISYQMVTIAGESLPLLMFLVALTCILFGLGMPTSGAYISVSILAAPALIEFGVPIIAAHLFVFYYALMSAVTPPVGSAALIASGISGGNYIRTALCASRLTLPGFILPVFFVYRPEILLLSENPFISIFVILTCFISVIALATVLEGFLFEKLKIWQMGILLIGIILSFNPSYLTSIISICTFVLVFIVQWKGKNIVNQELYKYEA